MDVASPLRSGLLLRCDWRVDGLSVPPGFLAFILGYIVFTGVTQRHLSLAFVDAAAGPVPEVIAVAADMLGTIRKAASLAPGVHFVRTIIPAAKVFFAVSPLGLFTPLDLGGLRRLGLQLILILRAAQPADRCLNIAVCAAEVTAADYALGRGGSETYRDWAFTS
ncbi:MAG: hypothetical protein ABI670_12345 [Chloroflexota bacterium]